jgi:hypothetical protein
MWIVLMIFSGLLHIFICHLSYNKAVHSKYWYLPLGTFLGVISNFFWCYATKILEGKNQLYFFSLLWDSMIVSIYCFLPLLFFDVKLNKMAYLALFLIVSGLILLKIFSSENT